MKIGTLLGKFLKADDLGGRRITVTIERVEAQKIEDDEKPVLYFVGKSKGLVLNRTNADSITDIVGSDETDDWEGQQVVLHPDTTMFAGKKVACIRIAPPKAGRDVAPAPESEPDPVAEYERDRAGQKRDDEIPF